MGLVYDPLLDVETVYFQTGQVNALACRYGLEHGWLDSVIHFRQRALLFLCTLWYKHSQPPLADRIGESWSLGRTPPNLCCGLLVCRMPSEATATFEPGLKGISSSLNQNGRWNCNGLEPYYCKYLYSINLDVSWFDLSYFLFQLKSHW
jgi:hypothetical protein